MFTNVTCDGSGLSIGIFDTDDDKPEIGSGHAKDARMDIAAASTPSVEDPTRHSGKPLGIDALTKFSALDLDSGLVRPASQKSNEEKNVDIKELKSWHGSWSQKQNAPRDSQSNVSQSRKVPTDKAVAATAVSLSDDDDDDESIGIEVVHSWSAEEWNALQSSKQSDDKANGTRKASAGNASGTRNGEGKSTGKGKLFIGTLPPGVEVIGEHTRIRCEKAQYQIVGNTWKRL